ncbi:hypothetical protein EST38_g5560 [Candolleomyces aberdarensis]|uniref:Nephrocystin 3-like N-terminal domain-containing protein n=1 Tax=Candolleomyces aberdarensis TaxID=2316362 RepID=A0A4Q2DK37_9AGAR|nr:hypothetical protein EST38_g5560 [Candolleomyces aberdarensis]
MFSPPHFLDPAGNSPLQYHESQDSIRPSRNARNENEIVNSSRSTALSMPSDEDFLQSLQPFPALQPYDGLAAFGTHGGAPSWFSGASGFQMRDLNVNVNNAGARSIDGWELLMKNIAPNALHDSKARYDPPKCDADTRVEVIGEIMEWIQDSNAPQRLLCMTGAAGSGKSALQQTIAERCTKSDILSAAFFLSSVDPTRNNTSLIVPTIAYQIGLKHYLFRTSVAAAVTHDPYVFSRSLQSQMDVLIVRPFENLRKSKQIGTNAFPYAILIDGLDECNGEPSNTLGIDDRRRAEDEQEELLAAIKHCIIDNDLPFRVFIASRPEWAIHTALEPGGLLREAAYHIQLSNKYDASGDMRRYLGRRFEDIGLRIGNSKWFSEGDIKTLVRAASGQFIYVATVYKYISERRASPVARLKIVLTWTPHEGQATRPFEALDRLYTNILLTAKNGYEAVDHGRDFLLLFKAHHMCVTGFTFFAIVTCPTAELLSAMLCLEPGAEETLISDLRSLVAFKTDGHGNSRLRLYHKSFSDFLKEPSRAKDLFVPVPRVYMHLAKCFMQHIIECPLDFDSLPANWEDLSLPELYRRSLEEVINDLPSFLNGLHTFIGDEVVLFTQNGGWQKINNLLPLLYRGGRFFCASSADWIVDLRDFTDRLKARKPEAAAIISVFAEKWKNDFKQYNDETRSQIAYLGWKLLLKNIAPNALHDSKARYGAPKCDEDTRTGVISEIMEWIQNSNAPQRLLCMTGAAGSGKSALEQTIAELCTKSDILSAAFFLSSTDPSRNTTSFIVPTIAYQMGLKHDLFRSSVAAAVRHDPYIFSRSLQSQMDVLIVRPFESLRRSRQIGSSTFPYAILIDGLDECTGESNTTSGISPVNVDDRRRAENQQEELLAAIKHCILDNDLPFRVFIASRPEWAIHTMLEPGGLLREVAYHIQLSHKYDASRDMRLYLRRRFEDIGLRIGNFKWFSEGDIETLVRAGSGQFIYVATAYKYISERRASPAARLKIVLTWTPREGQATRPFEALDRLYTNILLAAKSAYEAVDSHHRRDFLLLLKALHMGAAGFNSFSIMLDPAADLLSALLCLEARAEETLISDLRSLVALQTDGRGNSRLRLYHKSFSDFLREPSRAKDLFVPEDQVYTHLAKCFMQHIIECPLDFDSLPAEWDELPLPKLYRRSLEEAVDDLPSFLSGVHAIDDEVVHFTQNGGWQKINSLLPPLYRTGRYFSTSSRNWIVNLRGFTDRLKARKPEAAAIINVFAEKWKDDLKQYSDERRSQIANLDSI